MINDSGYFHADERGTEDLSHDLSVNSAGHYRLLTQRRFETIRPAGRADFQLLYVAQGRVEFHLDGGPRPVEGGSVVLYHPHDRQQYLYRLGDRPDAYWVHFTGHDAGAILARAGFTGSGVYRTGPDSAFALLIQKMIQELQLKKERHHQISNLYLKELIELLARRALERRDAYHNAFVEKAIVEFHQSYHLPIRVDDYARKHNISSCWFIRSFKRCTGATPQQYITGIRMDKAKELLFSSSFNCGEIAQSVGYADPLYFSRVFRQHIGVSPQEYRKNARRDA